MHTALPYMPPFAPNPVDPHPLPDLVSACQYILIFPPFAFPSPPFFYRRKCKHNQQNMKKTRTPAQKIHLSCLARLSIIRMVSPLTPNVLATLYSLFCVFLSISRWAPRSPRTAWPLRMSHPRVSKCPTQETTTHSFFPSYSPRNVVIERAIRLREEILLPQRMRLARIIFATHLQLPAAHYTSAPVPIRGDAAARRRCRRRRYRRIGIRVLGGSSGVGSPT